MTPDQAYERTKYQTPGVRLIVGPTEAREDFVKPLSYLDSKELPGDSDWYDYDTGKRFGKSFSFWETFHIYYAEFCAGRKITDDEILWLMEKNRTLADVRKWQFDLYNLKGQDDE